MICLVRISHTVRSAAAANQDGEISHHLHADLRIKHERARGTDCMFNPDPGALSLALNAKQTAGLDAASA